MRMAKFLIFKVNEKKLGIKACQLVNIIKNVTLPFEELNEKPVCVTSMWGMTLPLVNLHQLINQSKADTKNILLVEVITDSKKQEIIGLTFDEICEITVLDDLLSYPFQFQTFDSPNLYKDVIIHYKDESLTILNLPQLWKFCQGKHIFSRIYLAN